MSKTHITQEVLDDLGAIVASEMKNRQLETVAEFLQLFTDDTQVGDLRTALSIYFTV